MHVGKLVFAQLMDYPPWKSFERRGAQDFRFETGDEGVLAIRPLRHGRHPA